MMTGSSSSIGSSRYYTILLLLCYLVLASYASSSRRLPAASNNYSKNNNNNNKNGFSNNGAARGGAGDDGIRPGAETTGDDDNDDDSSSDDALSNGDTCTNEVCRHVRRTLNLRILEVISGERENAFARHYRTTGSHRQPHRATLVSTHGRRSRGTTAPPPTVAEPPGISGTRHPNELLLLDDDGSGGTDRAFPSGTTSLDIALPSHILALATRELTARQKDDRAEDRAHFSRGVTYVPRLVFRAVQLGINFTPVLSTAGIAVVSTWYREKIWFGLVGGCLARCGPAFIKWGQWASTRSDMFPIELCAALTQLHADAPNHSWRITQRTVERALCIPKGTILQVFESFETKPVASGSIAQLHRAVLRRPHGSDTNGRIRGAPSGQQPPSQKRRNGNNDDVTTTIAIKVRHPNVSRLIEMDFRLMRTLADVLDHLPYLHWLRLRSSMEQFSHTMAAQADLDVEAHHLELLNYNFRRWEDVGFPKPIFACGSVIIETFERGRICTDVIDGYDDLAKGEGKGGGMRGYELMPTSLSKFVVTEGLGVYLKMLLVDNLMHADLHPGNIMLDCHLFGDSSRSSSSKTKQNGLSSLPVITPLLALEDVVPKGGGDGTKSSTAPPTPNDKKRQAGLRTAEFTGGFYGHITLVDAGMVAQLDEDESNNFIGLMSSLGEGDGRTAARAVLRFSSGPEGDYARSGDGGDGDCSSCGGGAGDDGEDADYHGDLTLSQRAAFTEDMVELFHERCRGYGTDVDVGGILRGILGLIKKHRVRIDANYATLVVNALCIESLGKRVCPSYNVLDAAKPLLRSHRWLCYDGLCHRSKFRRMIMKIATPLLFMKKNAFDNNFFRQIEKERKHGTGGSIRFSPKLMVGVVAGIAYHLRQEQREEQQKQK